MQSVFGQSRRQSYPVFCLTDERHRQFSLVHLTFQNFQCPRKLGFCVICVPHRNCINQQSFKLFFSKRISCYIFKFFNSQSNTIFHTTNTSKGFVNVFAYSFTVFFSGICLYHFAVYCSFVLRKCTHIRRIVCVNTMDGFVFGFIYLYYKPL